MDVLAVLIQSAPVAAPVAGEGELNFRDFLAPTVIGSVAGAIGSLLTMFLKDFVGVRSFEKWKFRNAQALAYDHYRWPICLAAAELSHRCFKRIEEREKRSLASDSVSIDVIANKSAERALTAEVDENYLRYRLMSDAYRLCCLLGWLEIYRRDLGDYDGEGRRKITALDACIQNVRNDLADGKITPHKDWVKWIDCVIFREEQRAIGHRMIANSPKAGVIDFGTFCSVLEADPTGVGEGKWFRIAAAFFASLKDRKDFRIERMERLFVHLVDLRACIAPASVLSAEGREEEDRKSDRERASTIKQRLISIEHSGFKAV